MNKNATAIDKEKMATTIRRGRVADPAESSGSVSVRSTGGKLVTASPLMVTGIIAVRGDG